MNFFTSQKAVILTNGLENVSYQLYNVQNKNHWTCVHVNIKNHSLMLVRWMNQSHIALLLV